MQSDRIRAVLFPTGDPDLPDTIQDTYDRLHLDWAITVLMGSRKVVRRLAAESGVLVDG